MRETPAIQALQRKRTQRVKVAPAARVQWGMNLIITHSGTPVTGKFFTIIERPANPREWAIVGHRIPADAIKNVSHDRIIALLPTAMANGIAVFVRIGREFYRVGLSV